MSIHQDFFNKTWQSLDKYIDKYWFHLWILDKNESDLQQFKEDLPEDFKQAYEWLLLIANKNKDKLVRETHYSRKRSRQMNIHPDGYTKITQSFISEQDFIDAILNNNITPDIFNPTCFSDNSMSNYRSIIITTEDYARRNERILNRYVWTTKAIRDTRIDKEALSKKEVIELTRSDIVRIDFKILHPLIYKRILYWVY